MAIKSAGGYGVLEREINHMVLGDAQLSAPPSLPLIQTTRACVAPLAKSRALLPSPLLIPALRPVPSRGVHLLFNACCYSITFSNMECGPRGSTAAEKTLHASSLDATIECIPTCTCVCGLDNMVRGSFWNATKTCQRSFGTAWVRGQPPAF